MVPLTRYIVLRPGQPREQLWVRWPWVPPPDLVTALVTPLIGENHRSTPVIHNGRIVDLFFQDDPALPFNVMATEIYRGAWHRSHPGMGVAHLPRIHGASVVFNRAVLF